MRSLKLAVLLTLISTAAGAEEYPPFSNLLAMQGLSILNAKDFKVVQFITHKGEERAFTTIIAEKDHTRIELEIQSPIPEKEAKRLSDSEYAVLQSLYAPRQTPYAGEVSEVIACARDERPSVVSAMFLGVSAKVLLANAGARFSYGVCDKSLIAYRSAFVAVFLAKSRRLIELRAFVPATIGRGEAEFPRALGWVREFRATTARPRAGE